MDISGGFQGPGVTGGATAVTSRIALGDAEPSTTMVTLTNTQGMEVCFLSRGGIIHSIMVPDRDGVLSDVVLGYSDMGRYINDKFYFGALVGRSANRIAGASFKLGLLPFELTRNDGPHHLHGGHRGFSAYEWKVIPFEREGEVGAELELESPAGDQGYPGRLTVRVRYTLTNTNEFLVEYRAQTDAPTPVNLTQHTYFNLAGCTACHVLDHELTVNASRYTPVDRALIPSGELRPVEGTPFDFRTPRRVGARISESDEQLQFGGGYDHNFVIDSATSGNGNGNGNGNGDGLADAALLFEPGSGRVLRIRTTKPGIQIYTGNELDEVRQGKSGAYVRHSGIALETQHFPDAPNHGHFPSTILLPGQEYYSKTQYQFSVAPDGDGA